MAISSVGNGGASALTFTARNTTKAADQLLQDMDTDQSGNVSKAEYQSFGVKLQAQQSLSQATGNSGTAKSPDPDAMFTAADKDGSQTLSVDELSSMMVEAENRSRLADASGSAAGGPPPRAGGVGGGGGAGGPPPGGTSAAAEAESSGGTSEEASSAEPADTDGDGVVSPAEQQSYDAADANWDGTVTPAEQQSYDAAHPNATSDKQAVAATASELT